MRRAAPPKFKDYTKAYFDESGVVTPEKRDELIAAYTPLIKYIASRLLSRLPPQITLEDLVNSGILGLIDAIGKFDLNKKVQFKTYAEFRIRGAMLDELRALDWVPRSVRDKISVLENAYSTLEGSLGRPASDEETAAFLKMDIDAFHRLLDETKSVSFVDIDLLKERSPELNGAFEGGKASDDPFAALNLRQIRDILAGAISELSEKERLLMMLYYYEELTMKEIGLVMGYTESRISQMHSKAVLRLRSKLKGRLAG